MGALIVDRRRAWPTALLLVVLALLASGCEGEDGDDAPDGGAASLGDEIERLVDEAGVASISVGVMRDGVLQAAVARGFADLESERPATPGTIYGLASCSKPIVGLAAALLIDEEPAVGLDDDVQDWLAWDPPLAHPDHPDVPITLRMLLHHTAGIAADSPADYDSYPKPDPDVALEPFLRGLLEDPDYWVGPPGEGELYSNLGIALAALVIERAAGEDFRRFCESRIFEPLGMHDTRWFFGDLAAEQQARHAMPHDADGEPYAIYAFNDYPSGLLRSTPSDLVRLMSALVDEGRFEGEQALPAAAVGSFTEEGLAIEAFTEDGVERYEHSGGEAGVTSYLTWSSDGSGYVYLINTDLDDGPTEALESALDGVLSGAAQ